MLRKIDKNIWVSEQQFKFLGLEVGTRMAVIRLGNGELIVISPIDVEEITIQQINELGNVTVIIAPNCYHHLFLTNFKSIYPDAEIWVAPGLDSKRPDITIDRIFNERGKIGDLDEVEYLLFAGFQTIGIGNSGILNEIVFWHRESQSLILTDTAFHFDVSFPWQTRLIARILGGDRQLLMREQYGEHFCPNVISCEPAPSGHFEKKMDVNHTPLSVVEPTLLEKLASRDKEQVKQSIQKVLCWNFHRVIMAHGSIIERDGKRQLQAGYERFLSTTNLQITR